MTESRQQTSGLMNGRKGLVMGVTNNHSIAWGIASSLSVHGATLAFTFQNDAIARRVRPLAASVGSRLVFECDVSNEGHLDAVFANLKEEWGELDFLVHAIAYSDKSELKGRYADTSRENFRRTMEISCYSFTDVTRRALDLMKNGGSLITLTYLGSNRTIPNYNVMGIAKAALEASVKYLAVDLGKHGIRVNALSPGPMRTLAGSAIANARSVYRFSAREAPLGRNIRLEEIGNAAVFLLSDLSSGVTGEIHYVDGGFKVIGIPKSEHIVLPTPGND